MQLTVRHPQIGPDAVETQFPVGPLEAQSGCVAWTLGPIDGEPLVHAPEVRRRREIELVDDARDERKLLGRPDRAANADRIVVGACRQA